MRENGIYNQHFSLTVDMASVNLKFEKEHLYSKYASLTNCCLGVGPLESDLEASCLTQSNALFQQLRSLANLRGNKLSNTS